MNPMAAPMPRPFRDLSGQRFGRLVVLVRPNFVPTSGVYWICRCDCGNGAVARADHLFTGRTHSCGCLRREATDRLVAMNTTHGGSHRDEYRIWLGMISRCESRSSKAYNDYGGRGIYVDVAWRRSFDAFLRDMGPRPSRRHSVDRINNDGPYAPGNCRWATRTEQANNRRSNRLVTYAGKTQNVAAWAAERGLTWDALYMRVHRGWPVEEAIMAPQMGRSERRRY